MDDVSDHEATLQFQYGYVVRKNISEGGGVVKHNILTLYM